MATTILVCDCGDCKHWEILTDGVKCMTCGEVYPLQLVARPAQGMVFNGLEGVRKASFQQVQD